MLPDLLTKHDLRAIPGRPRPGPPSFYKPPSGGFLFDVISGCYGNMIGYVKDSTYLNAD